MAEKAKEGHNGHRVEPTGIERIRSGFDRRRNWGDSIENVYRRIDHRLSELTHDTTDKGNELREEAEEYISRYPAPALAVCLAVGLFVGFLLGRKGQE